MSDETKDTADYDGAYRELLSNEVVVRQLIERFVDESLREELDFTTMERMETSFVKRSMMRRHSDMFWKVERKSRSSSPVYCVVMLEFQSSPDTFMALRVLEYAVELYRQQINANTTHASEHGLPPILPLVLHHSDKTWNAKTSVRDLIALNEDDPLIDYQPALRYLLLDEQDLGLRVLEDEPNIPAQLFRLHTIQDPRELARAFELLFELSDEHSVSLELLASWLRHALSHTNPTVKIHREELLDIITRKGEPMFPQNLEKIFQKEHNKGFEKGREEGQLLLLARLLERKFGADPARSARLDGLSFEQRERLGELVFDFDDEAALFDAALLPH